MTRSVVERSEEHIGYRLNGSVYMSVTTLSAWREWARTATIIRKAD